MRISANLNMRWKEHSTSLAPTTKELLEQNAVIRISLQQHTQWPFLVTLCRLLCTCYSDMFNQTCSKIPIVI